MQESIIIVGGGPAGAATALTLARRGISCLVLEAASQITSKIGETLPPNCTPTLQRLGVDVFVTPSEHLPCFGNYFLWGNDNIQEKPFILYTHGQGWHLDRQRFETSLWQLCKEQGVQRLFNSKVIEARRKKEEGWTIQVQRKGQSTTLNASFIVDATGRSSKIARGIGIKRNQYDRLIGVACAFSVSVPHSIEQYTYIEATEMGWWYMALLPDNRLMTVYMTDADLLDHNTLKSKNFLVELRDTLLIGPLIPDEAEPEESKLVPRPASTSHLPKLYDRDWLAVGDAAFAYDPISSYGLSSALGGGFYAGNAIADHMLGREEALPTYGSVIGEAFLTYFEMLAGQYFQEQRWSDSPFWKRRHQLGR